MNYALHLFGFYRIREGRYYGVLRLARCVTTTSVGRIVGGTFEIVEAEVQVQNPASWSLCGLGGGEYRQYLFGM